MLHHRKQNIHNNVSNGYTDDNSSSPSVIESSCPEGGGYFYLSSRARTQLPNYVYNSKDKSITSKYILSPFSTALVENFTPIWLAPNAITLMGLSLMLLSYSFMWYYCPNLNEGLTQDDQVPRWIFLFNFFAMLAYQTLDAMDGKQARRTKSSSPLGMLFDHACDALNCLPGSVNWAVTCGLSFESNPIKAWFIISCPLCLFWVTTWEEYFTGYMELPVINGASEGVLAGAVFSLVSFFGGVGFWHETFRLNHHISNLLPSFIWESDAVEIKRVDFLFGVCVFWLVQEEIIKIYQVTSTYGRQSILMLSPYFFLMTISTYIGAVHKEFVSRNTRACLHLVGALFSEMTIQLIVDHMTKEKYNPFRLSLIPLVFLLLALESRESDIESAVDSIVLIYATVTWTFLFSKLFLLIHEMCSTLKIWCFDIVTPRA